MLGILVLAVAVAGIVRMARARGASLPLRYGLLAGVGWLVLGMLTGFALSRLGFQSETGELTYEAMLITTAIPWAFVALVALYVKFLLGHGTEPPAGRSTCPRCGALNPVDAPACTSCGKTLAPDSAQRPAVNSS